MRRKRRTHKPEFKAKVALAAVQGDLTMAELVKKFDVHANQVTEWKKQLLSSAPEVFGSTTNSKEESEEEVQALRAKIGQLTMDTAFCIDAIEEAIERNGAPEIFNTDQGSQFTSEDFTGVLKSNEIAISMDGKRRWVDNVFVERLWRSVKYEEVYLHAYDDIRAAKASLNRYFEFYNTERKHQSLGDQVPDRVYYEAVERMAA